MREEACGGCGPNYVCDVAVPCGFERPRWKVRLSESVLLGEGKYAGVNLACR